MKPKMNQNSFSTIYSSELDSQFFTLSKILRYLEVNPSSKLSAIHEQIQLCLSDITFFLSETFALNFMTRKNKPARLRDFEQFHSFVMNVIELDLVTDMKLNFLVDYLNLLHGHTLKIQQLFINALGEDFKLPVELSPRQENNLKEQNSKAQPNLRQVDGQNDSMVYELDRRRQHLYQDDIKDAQELLTAKDYKGALVFLHKAGKLKNSSQLLGLMAHCEYHLGNIEKAMKNCLQAINLDPSYGKSYLDLGQYLAKEGKWTEAVQWFTKAKKSGQAEFQAIAYLQTAKIFIKQKNYPLALKELEEALPWAQNSNELKQNITKLLQIIENRDKNLTDKSDREKTFH